MSSLAILALKDGVKLDLEESWITEQALKFLTPLQLLLRQAEHLKRLFIGDKAAFHSQTLISYNFSNHVEAIDLGLLTLLIPAKLLMEVVNELLVAF